MPAAADRLYQCLEHEVPWTLAYIDGDTASTLPHDRLRTLSQPEWLAINQAIQGRAREKFQFMYNSYMMVQAYIQKRDPQLLLHKVLEFLNSPAFIGCIRGITGDGEIVKADAQATRYLAGHFLKRHDDTNIEEGRRFAYVLSLTRDWQADWGGLLHFLDADGNVIDAFMPRYNALNLFQVPAQHYVSYVAPYARGARYAITGWLRTDDRIRSR